MDKEYESLKLSNKKKNAMIQAIKYGKPLRRKKSYVGIVTSIFVLGVLLFSIIIGSGSESPVNKTGAGIDLHELTHEVYFKQLLILWSVSLLFLMMAFVQFLLLAKNPERLIEYPIFRKAHAVFGTWRMVFIGAIPFVWIAFETIVILIWSSELVVQFFVVLMLFINYALIQLKFVKGRTRATCPHCGVELTNKEINLNKKCGVCGNGRMRKAQNSIQEFISTFGGVFIMFFPFFQLSLFYVFLYGIAYVYFTLNYILPYLSEFEKESEIPPPLW